MIAWADQMLKKAQRRIRLREPQTWVIHTGAPAEKIDAEFDAGNRLVRLIVHTRSESLARRRRV